jgi:hypothetical protein
MLTCCGSSLSARTTPLEENAIRLWKVYNRLPQDSLVKAIDVLFELRSNYLYQSRHTAVDSITAILMDRVRISGDDALIISTMFRWFKTLDAEEFRPLSIDDSASVSSYVHKMMSIARAGNNPEWECEAWYASARYHVGIGDFSKAREDMSRAWYAVSLTENKELKIRCLLLTGYCEESELDKLAAFRHYADALYLAREMDDPTCLVRCYEQMFSFYYQINNYEKAEGYVYKTLPILLKAPPVDSVSLMHQLSNLVFLQCSLRDYDAGIRTARMVLDYAIRTGNKYLEIPVFATVRSVLMEHGEYRRLQGFCLNYYPKQFEAFAQTEPASYYQLKAAFAEADRQSDSANHYYELAGREILSKPRGAGTRAFFLRSFGRFLLQWNKPDRALVALDSALKYAVKAEYLPYMAELSGQLDSLYALKGDSARAYTYARLNKQYSDRLFSANRQDEILALDLENEIRTRELLAQQEELRTRHRHNIQYMGITLLIGVCFAVLVMLGVFPVPRWLISAMGFISFIFLFEFIILIIDHKVHELTHGEPWMVLGIKVIIIAGLLPFHHWLEHKVVHYLHHHPIMAGSREKLRPMLQKLRRFLPKKAPALPRADEKVPSVKPVIKVPLPKATTSKKH